MALIFIIAGSIGLLATLLAFQSRAYEDISRSYAGTRPEPAPTRAPED
jgi:hypothetical protein